MGKVIGYAVMRTEGELVRLCDLTIGPTLEDGKAICRVFQLTYPTIGKAAVVVELREVEID